MSCRLHSQRGTKIDDVPVEAVQASGEPQASLEHATCMTISARILRVSFGVDIQTDLQPYRLAKLCSGMAPQHQRMLFG